MRVGGANMIVGGANMIVGGADENYTNNSGRG